MLIWKGGYGAALVCRQFDPSSVENLDCAKKWRSSSVGEKVAFLRLGGVRRTAKGGLLQKQSQKHLPTCPRNSLLRNILRVNKFRPRQAGQVLSMATYDLLSVVAQNRTADLLITKHWCYK
ncbi:MAG: hypothetical protein IPH22_12170 [Nitrosomonas sp.]|nr:hypothetical protein [Nitrosomonas sp.]